MKGGLRVTHTYRQNLAASATEVFPLICPVREAEWLDGFEHQMVYSRSGFAEKGCVFTTAYADEPDTLWTITQHDRDKGRVEFFRVTPGWLVTQIEVDLRDAQDNTCTAQITYTHTSLGPEGDAAIEGRHSEQNFLKMVQTWERSLNHFLCTGQTLQIAH